MDEAVVKNAKRIAKQSEMSLSAVVGEYFRVAVKSKNVEFLKGIPPLVMSMIGILTDDGKTYKEIRAEYYRHLEDKHNKQIMAEIRGGKR